MKEFDGVKIAMFLNDKLVMIQRDNKPGLRFAGMWDFPGGGREGNETPFECARREIKEELAVNLLESSIVWQKDFPAMHDPTLTAYFLVAKIREEDIKDAELGIEGQGWALVDMKEFFSRDDVVPHLKGRLQAYLDNV